MNDNLDKNSGPESQEQPILSDNSDQISGDVSGELIERTNNEPFIFSFEPSFDIERFGVRTDLVVNAYEEFVKLSFVSLNLPNNNLRDIAQKLNSEEGSELFNLALALNEGYDPALLDQFLNSFYLICFDKKEVSEEDHAYRIFMQNVTSNYKQTLNLAAAASIIREEDQEGFDSMMGELDGLEAQLRGSQITRSEYVERRRRVYRSRSERLNLDEEKNNSLNILIDESSNVEDFEKVDSFYSQIENKFNEASSDEKKKSISEDLTEEVVEVDAKKGDEFDSKEVGMLINEARKNGVDVEIDPDELTGGKKIAVRIGNFNFSISPIFSDANRQKEFNVLTIDTGFGQFPTKIENMADNMKNLTFFQVMVSSAMNYLTVEDKSFENYSSEKLIEFIKSFDLSLENKNDFIFMKNLGKLLKSDNNEEDGSYLTEKLDYLIELAKDKDYRERLIASLSQEEVLPENFRFKAFLNSV